MDLVGDGLKLGLEAQLFGQVVLGDRLALENGAHGDLTLFDVSVLDDCCY
jgi:hypothetical protein